MFNIRDARQYMERLLWIRTKEGEEKRLILKPAQKRLMDTVEQLERQGKPVRIIVLKARQEGISTAISGFIFARCATRENRAAMLVAHKAEATANLYNMHKRFYDRLPTLLRPMRAASNAIEIVFANPSKNPEDRAREPGLRSRIRCATAGGEGVGRSDTLQYVHISEYAFWPDGVNAKKDALLGILQAVPALPGTAVFIESTPNGFDDFHKLWTDAVAGRNDFVPLFIPWSEEPGYRRPVDPGTVWTEEERALMERHGLDPEQMAWRRWCIANNCGGDLNRFHQEYPLTPEEAFIASGDCWFDTEVLTKRLGELETGRADVGIGPYEAGNGRDGGQAMLVPTARAGDADCRVAAPLARTGSEGGASGGRRIAAPTKGRFTYRKVWSADLQSAVLADIAWVEDPRGPVTIWREPEELVPYVLGGDTAGEGSDFFSAYVIDNTSAGMCARIWMQRDEAGYTEQVYCLGLHYNKALVGLEVNFSTYPTATLTAMGYPKLYVRQAEDSYTHEIRKAFGFRTDPVTRPALVSELRAAVHAHPEMIADADLIREMLVFVKDAHGRPAAMTGEHDDLVMGYGITLKIRGQQSAVKGTRPGRRGHYTQDMLEDWRAATPAQRREIEKAWGKPF